jgi:glutamyl aminopeptidase
MLDDASTAVLLPSPVPCAQRPKGDGPWCTLRLPQDEYKPIRYDLTMEPDLEPTDKSNKYNGTVTIYVEVFKPTSTFLVHIKFLNITNTMVEGSEVKDSFHYEDNQFWVIMLKEKVSKGQVAITLEFEGSLTHGIVGFYKSTYKGSSGKTHNLATSKFEPTDARKGFPCMDEPNLKANFTVKMIYKDSYNGNKGYYALSNMPVDKSVGVDGIEDLGNGRKKTTFRESVKMSTYLVCFIVCDFEKKSKTTKKGVDVTVYAPRGRIAQTNYALDVGVKVLEYYEEFFNIPYPLPKQDMIAIPDFPSGAMEHWGLVTYRMTAMLYDPKQASFSDKRRVATVIAHELAHMWFGNLVTMDWWNDLWLNEGFASFIEYLGVDAAEPSWAILDQFLPMDMRSVMILDSTTASHKIIADVKNPSQITELFDTITYKKGSSTIRMLESFMGKTDFKNGVTAYLKEHQFGNAKTDDLWTSLTNNQNDAANKKDIKKIMHSWTTQSNYPLVTVKSRKQEEGKTVLVLEQDVFLLNPESGKNRDMAASLWNIPIHYKTKSAKPILAPILGSREFDLNLGIHLPKGDFYKLNAGQTGFYRVKYDKANLQALVKLLQEHHEELDSVDRAGLLDDAFNLARAGKLPYEVALDMTGYLDREEHLVPWEIASANIDFITNFYQGAGIAKWRRFIASKAGAALTKLGFEEKSDDTSIETWLRPNLIALACKHGNEMCLVKAQQLFNKWLEDPKGNPVPVNIRAGVYKFGMKFADEDQWHQVFESLKATDVSQEKAKFIAALAMQKAPEVLNRYIEYAKDEDMGIKSQDYYTVLEAIAGNPAGLPIVWEYIQSHWRYLVDRFTINDRGLGRMVQRVTSHFQDELKLKEVEAFFAANPEAGAGKRARNEALATIKDNIIWKKKYEKDITAWLDKQNDI